MLEGGGKLVYGLWAKCVAHLRAVEGDANHAQFDVTVIGDVGEGLKTRNFAPNGGVEQLGYLISHESRLTT